MYRFIFPVGYRFHFAAAVCMVGTAGELDRLNGHRLKDQWRKSNVNSTPIGESMRTMFVLFWGSLSKSKIRCVYVYVYVYTYTYIYTHTHLYTYMYVCISIYISMYR